MKNITTADHSTEPWIRIWISQVLVTGSMWRGARPLNPDEPNPDGDALVSLFEPMGPEPPVVRSAISTMAGFVRELIEKAPPRTKCALTLWIDRHRSDLVAAADSLCVAYGRDIESVRRVGPEEVHIDGLSFVPACAFEAIFISWIYKVRPVVLRRAIDMISGVLFAIPSEPEFHKAMGEVMKDVRTLSDIASRLSSHIKLLRRPGPFQNMAAYADRFGLKRFEDSLASVTSFLAPIMSELKAKGRRSDPLRSVVVRCFRAAGLSDGDIAAILDVKKDAVRKQARKAAPKAGVRARPKTTTGRTGRGRSAR
jgi:hypothetical protein